MNHMISSVKLFLFLFPSIYIMFFPFFLRMCCSFSLSVHPLLIIKLFHFPSPPFLLLYSPSLTHTHPLSLIIKSLYPTRTVKSASDWWVHSQTFIYLLLAGFLSQKSLPTVFSSPSCFHLNKTLSSNTHWLSCKCRSPSSWSHFWQTTATPALNLTRPLT